jgi:hypothetical protein
MLHPVKILEKTTDRVWIVLVLLVASADLAASFCYLVSSPASILTKLLFFVGLCVVQGMCAAVVWSMLCRHHAVSPAGP